MWTFLRFCFWSSASGSGSSFFEPCAHAPVAATITSASATADRAFMPSPRPWYHATREQVVHAAVRLCHHRTRRGRLDDLHGGLQRQGTALHELVQRRQVHSALQ